MQADSSLPAHTPAQRTELSGGREGGHVAGGLGDDYVGADPAQFNRRGEGGEPLHHRGRETVDRPLEQLVQPAQVRAYSHP
jgi:hypothetical protein